MKKIAPLFFLLTLSFIGFGQSVDEPLSKEKMKKDLEVFKAIRLKANSGLYKYRTKQQIDSIYNWAQNEINISNTYLDFYKIICQITDYEGSLHNDTYLPKKQLENLKKESFGYFPYPIKWIEGKWVINYKGGELPLGAEILEIDHTPISEIIASQYKYYTTDGYNLTGKRPGIRKNFSKYYRLNHGQKENFNVSYKRSGDHAIATKVINSVSYSSYYKNFEERHSSPIDQIYYKHLEDNEKYSYEKIDAQTGKLTIHSFAIGADENSTGYIQYATYLDSIFTSINATKLENLIVDIRYNGGGTAASLLLPYEYLTQRDFCENKSAWITFRKIPYLKYIATNIPRFLRPLGVNKYNKMFQREFPIAKDGVYHQGATSKDRQIRKPRNNGFRGNIYLLINPEVASAASNFGSLVASNDNVVIVGEETMGGYYGHNGHAPMTFSLPKTKLRTMFSVVNLEQFVKEKENQKIGRGIIPDYNIPQSYQDFLNNEDPQLKYVLELIKKEKTIANNR